MGKVKELYFETQEAGYDVNKLSIEEMLEIRQYGRLKCSVRESETRIDEEAERYDALAEQEAYVRAMTSFGPRNHFEA